MKSAADVLRGNPVDIAKAILENEWDAIHKRLMAYAVKLVGALGTIDGVSPDDLVSETLLAYLADDDGLNWDSLRGSSIDRFLCGVLKKKFLMHLRRNRTSSGSVGEILSRAQPLQSEDSMPASVKADQLAVAARGDKELEDLLAAGREIEDVGSVNQQLSVSLGTTIEDVVNRKRRLTRRLRQIGRNPHRERTQDKRRDSHDV